MTRCLPCTASLDERLAQTSWSLRLALLRRRAARYSRAEAERLLDDRIQPGAYVHVGANLLDRCRGYRRRIAELDERFVGEREIVGGLGFVVAATERCLYERPDIRVATQLGDHLLERLTRSSRGVPQIDQRLLRVLKCDDVVKPAASRASRFACGDGGVGAQLLGGVQLGSRARVDERRAIALEYEIVRRAPRDRQQALVMELMVPGALCRLPGYAA